MWSLSNEEGILNIANLDLYRIDRTTLQCQYHESSLLILHWMGCRRCFVSHRLKKLDNEDDSRSSSRHREHKNFLLVSKLHMAIQTPWNRCLCARTVWTKRMVLHKRIFLFLHDLRLHCRLRLCLDLNVEQTISQLKVSLFFQLDFWSLVGFIGSLYHLQQLQNPILSSKCFWKKICDRSLGDACTSS